MIELLHLAGKLVQPIQVWEPTTSPGREVAPVPVPVGLARPCAQYAVRTPSKDKPSGYYQAVLFSSRPDLGMGMGLPLLHELCTVARVEPGSSGTVVTMGFARHGR